MRRPRCARLALLVALPGVLGTARPAAAQQATISASVPVLLPPATGTGLRALDFGAVFPGSTREVLPSDPLSGWFQLENVGKNKDVRLTFTFPTLLVRAGGGDGLPAHFDGPYVQSCGNGCQTHTVAPTAAGPAHTSAVVVHVRPTPFGANPRTIDLFIGGRLEPEPDQAAGVYQGVIELVFAVL
jgi:hypothetical protein